MLADLQRQRAVARGGGGIDGGGLRDVLHVQRIRDAIFLHVRKVRGLVYFGVHAAVGRVHVAFEGEEPLGRYGHRSGHVSFRIYRRVVHHRGAGRFAHGVLRHRSGHLR